MKKLSIIITSYNYAHYINETINSVLEQDYQDWELIIVDDGSKDNSVEIINQYVNQDQRIKLYQHDGGINKGLAESLQLGLSKCTNEWVVFLESDDKLRKDSLSKRVGVLEQNPDVDLIFSDFEPFQDSGISTKMLDYIKDRENKYFSLNKSGLIEKFDKLISKGNIIMTFSIVMIKKSILETCDFNSPVRAHLDYYLWSQVSDKTIYYLAEKLTYWRMHSDSYMYHFPNQQIVQRRYKLKLYLDYLAHTYFLT